jgi:hypothetical protein
MDSCCVYRAARTEYLIVIQAVLVFEGLTLFLPLFRTKLDYCIILFDEFKHIDSANCWVYKESCEGRLHKMVGISRSDSVSNPKLNMEAKQSFLFCSQQ